MEKVRLYCEIHTSNIRRIENKYATYHNVNVILITSNDNYNYINASTYDLNQYADKIANIGSILYRSKCLVFRNDIRFIALGYECRKVT